MPTLQFKGKTAVETYHYTVPHHTLGFDPAASVLDAGQTTPSLEGNLIIEGDNLLALKALLPTHTSRIKCIYIDPPYNTGNEGWVYNDNLTQPQFKEWIGEVVGKEGEDACRHDKWCCMMYPRLMLLKELLRDDGAIFISLDDNEIGHLRLLMNEVFGEENFVADISVVNNLKGRSDDQYIATAHEHLLVYRKTKTFQTYGLPVPAEYQEEYSEQDENGEMYRLQGLRKRGSNSRREDRPNLHYPFFCDTLGASLAMERSNASDLEIWPKLSDQSDGCWRWGKDTAGARLGDLTIRKVSGRNEFDVFQKDYLLIGGDLKTLKPKSFWLNSSYSTDAGTRIYKKLMGRTEFSNPKSPYFLADIFRQCTKENDLILDSFAGSGTTGQAVLELNKEDGGNRNFVLVQQTYDSKDDEKKKLNICRTITAERVRRVIAGRGVPATGGGFTYARVSDTPLFGEYRDFGDAPPPYEDLAKYIFYTETSRQWDPVGMNRETGKIGTHGGTSYFLLYTPDGEANAALDLKWLGNIAASDPNTRLVVYCEKFWMHRDELRRWEGNNHKSVRAMIVPFQLK